MKRQVVRKQRMHIVGNLMHGPKNGAYYTFDPESIKLFAPAESGVYGLDNFKHRIMVSHAPNLKDALLDHECHSNFYFRRFRPTRFTFEICPPETREKRAQELITIHKPIAGLGGRITYATIWRHWKDIMTTRINNLASLNRASGEPLPAPSVAHETLPEPPHKLRDQCVLIGGGFVMGVVLMIFLGSYLEQVTARSRIELQANKISQLAMPVVEEATADDRASAPSFARIVAPPTLDTGKPSAPTNRTSSTSVPPKRQTVQVSLKPRQSVILDQVTPWAVQVRSFNDLPTARRMKERLADKGYQVDILASKISDQIWYRLRVGRFATREETTGLWQLLRDKEGFRDAFMAKVSQVDVPVDSTMQ